MHTVSTVVLNSADGRLSQVTYSFPCEICMSSVVTGAITMKGIPCNFARAAA